MKDSASKWLIYNKKGKKEIVLEEKEVWVDRNETERVRIARSEFKEKELMDIRIYYQAANGDWLPTKKGVNISYDKLQEVKDALNQL